MRAWSTSSSHFDDSVGGSCVGCVENLVDRPGQSGEALGQLRPEEDDAERSCARRDGRDDSTPSVDAAKSDVAGGQPAGEPHPGGGEGEEVETARVARFGEGGCQQHCACDQGGPKRPALNA